MMSLRSSSFYLRRIRLITILIRLGVSQLYPTGMKRCIPHPTLSGPSFRSSTRVGPDERILSSDRGSHFFCLGTHCCWCWFHTHTHNPSASRYSIQYIPVYSLQDKQACNECVYVAIVLHSPFGFNNNIKSPGPSVLFAPLFSLSTSIFGVGSASETVVVRLLRICNTTQHNTTQIIPVSRKRLIDRLLTLSPPQRIEYWCGKRC